MKLIIRHLKNKMTTAYIPMPNSKVAAVSVWFKAGGRYENKRNLGISHFLEHLVFRGSKTRTAMELKQAIEGIGGYINAFTSREYTCFYVKVPKKYISTAIDILSDMTINPLMQAEDIKKEKKIIAEEIKMYQDIPSYFIEDLIDEIMWKNHPLGRPLAGTYGSVHNISYQMLKKFKSKFYNSLNTAVVCAGGINISKTSEIIKEKFANLKPRKPIKFKGFSFKKHKLAIKYINKDTKQTHLNIGFHTTARIDPDRYPLVVLSTLLGGNMSSRLFQRIREEEGLAYQISTSLKKYYDSGGFIIAAGIRNDNIIKATELILKELERIKQEDLNKEELKKAKEYVLGNLLIGLENSTDRMLWAGTKIITSDRTLNVDEVTKNIKRVKVKDIKRVAEKFLNKDNINLALIGPIKNKIRQIIKIANKFN